MSKLDWQKNKVNRQVSQHKREERLQEAQLRGLRKFLLRKDITDAQIDWAEKRIREIEGMLKV